MNIFKNVQSFLFEMFGYLRRLPYAINVVVDEKAEKHADDVYSRSYDHTFPWFTWLICTTMVFTIAAWLSLYIAVLGIYVPGFLDNFVQHALVASILWSVLPVFILAILYAVHFFKGLIWYTTHP